MLPVEIKGEARREIREWPIVVRQDLGAVLQRLQEREPVGMPDVRAMPSVGKGVLEIRVRDQTSAYRAFLVHVGPKGIVVFHAFAKKSRKTPLREIDLGKRRLRALSD